MKQKNLILDKLWRNPVIDDILSNITNNHPLMSDLKSELFLILLNQPETKIIQAEQNKWLVYLAINIIKKMWNSKSSPFYVKYKKNKDTLELNDTNLADDEDFNYNDIETIINIVMTFPFVERELFFMRYKIGKYDRYFGELRDVDCKKPVSSFRNIEKKLRIDGDKPISIDHNTIQVYHSRTIEKIKKIMKKYD